jgi:hypothetical protein
MAAKYWPLLYACSLSLSIIHVYLLLIWRICYVSLISVLYWLLILAHLLRFVSFSGWLLNTTLGQFVKIYVTVLTYF